MPQYIKAPAKRHCPKHFTSLLHLQKSSTSRLASYNTVNEGDSISHTFKPFLNRIEINAHICILKAYSNMKIFALTWTILLIFLLLPARAQDRTTYYVANNGSDSSPGSSTEPWLTIQKAANTMLAGDTVVVQAGIYPERVSTVAHGAQNAPITFKASGAVTNYGFRVKHDYITVDGFQVSGDAFAPNYEGAIEIYRTADYGQIINNYIHDFPAYNNLSNRIYGIHFVYATNYMAGSQSFIVSNNVIFNTTYAMLVLYGASHLVVSNRFDTSNERDAIIIFGRGHMIRGNLFTNLNSHPIIEDHTDLFQTFGNELSDSFEIRIEDNVAINCAAQIGQLEQKGRPDIRDWVMANNLFVNVGMACNVDIENMHILNNTFIRCTTNTAGPILLNCNIKGCASNAVILNNIFYECGSRPVSPDFGWYHAENTNFSFIADFNYVCGSNYAAKTFTKFVESHGINGGDPLFSASGTGDYRLALSSPLLSKGYGFDTNVYPIPFVYQPTRPNPNIGALPVGGDAPRQPTGLRVP